MAPEKNPRSRLSRRTARRGFNYAIEDTVEAGIVLTGNRGQIIAQRQHHDCRSYVDSKDGEIWLVNANIPEYAQANRFNHEPKRDRKLLLHKKQINKLIGSIEREGMTLIPLKMYFNERGMVKPGNSRSRRAKSCTTNATLRRSATGREKKDDCCERRVDRMNQPNLMDVDWSRSCAAG